MTHHYLRGRWVECGETNFAFLGDATITGTPTSTSSLTLIFNEAAGAAVRVKALTDILRYSESLQLNFYSTGRSSLR